MNKDLTILRESIGKIVQMIAGRGLTVTQIGASAYVKTDAKGKPTIVNIPHLPDEADDALIMAIQGFIDHEVAHVLFTDWNVAAEIQPLAKQKAKKLPDKPDDIFQRLRSIDNIIEDTFIERKMGEKFPGAKWNMEKLHGFFLEKVTAPALAQIKKAGADPLTEFSVLFVPMARALAGQEAFKEFMDKNGYWKHPLVKSLMDELGPKGVDEFKTISNSEDALKLAEKVFDILFPPDDQEKQKQSGDGDGDDEEGDDSGEPNKNKGKKGKGKLKKDDSNDKSESGDAKGGKGSKDKSKKNPSDKSDGSGDDGDQDAKNKRDKSKTPRSDGSESEDDDSGSSEKDDDSQEDGSDSDEGEDQDEQSDGGSEESSDDSDDDQESDGDETEESGSSEGDDDESEGSSGEVEDGEEEGGKGAAESDPTGETAKGKPTGRGKEGSPFYNMPVKLDDDAFAAAIKKEITDAASRETRGAPYTVYSEELDIIQPFPIDVTKDEWLVNMESKIGHMIGPMQKDIERLMAARSAVVRVGGFTSGRVKGNSLHRLMGNDPRVFDRKQENKSKDTAVSLVIDNSGSMAYSRGYSSRSENSPIKVAMAAGLALSQTLERLTIKNEVLGFTTVSYGQISHTKLSDHITEATAEIERMNAGSVRKTFHFSRVEPLYIPIYKSFDERLTSQVKQRFAAAAERHGSFGSGNIDGESVDIALRRLVTRKESRKVMFVLSDGYPAGASGSQEELYSHLHKVVADAERAGVEVIGIGILSEAVKTFYPKHIILNNLEELPSLVMGELKKVILK
jgi:cobalamin biosynthesis protein CobT